MATHVIRKVVDKGVGFSAVDLNDVRHVFATAVPRRGSTLGQQASDALRTIEAVIEQEGTADSIVHQAVFLADVNQVDECRRMIRDFYGSKMPATSYIPQPPCEGKLLSIEALGVGRGTGEVEIERISEQLVIARHNGIAWVHCAQTVPQLEAGGVYDGGVNAFEQMRSLFASVGVGFEQVIRTWLYLGGIVADEGPTQRYKELNRARTDFFQGLKFRVGRPPDGFHGSVYPASTGIGTEGRGIMMSAIALATERDDILAVPLENPRQTSAHEYPDHYSPKSPKFSRAMALSCGTYATIFISGTASITASETRHVGNAGRPDRRNPGQHRRPDLRGKPGPSRPARTRHRAGQPGPGPRLHQAAGGLRARSGRCARSGWASCPPSTPWPTFAVPSCWSRSKALRFPTRRRIRSPAMRPPMSNNCRRAIPSRRTRLTALSGQEPVIRPGRGDPFAGASGPNNRNRRARQRFDPSRLRFRPFLGLLGDEVQKLLGIEVLAGRQIARHLAQHAPHLLDRLEHRQVFLARGIAHFSGRTAVGGLDFAAQRRKAGILQGGGPLHDIVGRLGRRIRNRGGRSRCSRGRFKTRCRGNRRRHPCARRLALGDLLLLDLEPPVLVGLALAQHVLRLRLGLRHHRVANVVLHRRRLLGRNGLTGQLIGGLDISGGVVLARGGQRAQAPAASPPAAITIRITISTVPDLPNGGAGGSNNSQGTANGKHQRHSHVRTPVETKPVYRLRTQPTF